MKIALVRRQFSATGGAELYVQRLLTALSQAGHEVHLFSEHWDLPPLGVAFHQVPVMARRAQRAIRFAELVARDLAGAAYDVVFSLDRTLKQDVYRAGDGVHRVWLERRRQFAPWWRRPFIGWGAFHRNLLRLEAQTFAAANTRLIMVNSEMVKREIIERFHFPAERIHLVRNGIEVARFQRGKREETRQRLGIGPGERLLLFVGSGWERKGLKYLLAAFAGLVRQVGPSDAPLKLLVVGKGKAPCFRPPGVLFAGPMAEVEHAYAAADLFVFPPIYEPSANVVAEALAAGLPVITTAQNGASEWIRPGLTGSVMARPDDVEALTAEIRAWLPRLPGRVRVDAASLSLERNVSETVAVLSLAREARVSTPEP